MQHRAHVFRQLAFLRAEHESWILHRLIVCPRLRIMEGDVGVNMSMVHAYIHSI